MSGGVDSSMAAYLLKKDGYDVSGATMLLTDDPSARENADDAAAVCRSLDIPFTAFDFKEMFREKVINNFIDEYKNGRTPNPCVVCNKHLKFGAFLDKAAAEGFDYVATGHYAKILSDPSTGEYKIKISDAGAKDQSYVLYNHTQHTLSKTLMPLGSYEKPQIREMAANLGIASANRPDSQEICFIRDDDYVRFIKETSGYVPKKGNFLDTDGNVIGTHDGIINYTIGQRKGLGAFGRPMFVMKIDVPGNNIILGEKGMEFGKNLVAGNLNFISGTYPAEEFRCLAKNRYQAKPAWCTVKVKNETAEITYDEPVRAITPGQSIVFYDGDYLLGGGIVADS